MNNFDEIFALWPGVGEMAADMGVSRGCVRRWIGRGVVAMAHWERLTEIAAAKFRMRIVHEDCVRAALARRGAPDRRVRAMLKQYRAPDAERREAA